MPELPTRTVTGAEVVIACRDLPACLEFYTRLGFRLESILPADDPRVAVVAGGGVRLRLQRSDADSGVHLRLEGPAAGELVAPDGTRLQFVPAAATEVQQAPATFVVTTPGAAARWVEGRAGMRYRDLIPGRQGGSLIASHIRIDRGGTVPDYVHFHRIAAQVIYCAAGWVRVVYEDQGEPFVMRAGDCVLQPPQIRHRVLECSDGLEVVEVTSPAEHETCADHDLALPTGAVRPGREFGGQRFVRHQADTAVWTPWHGQGFAARDTGIDAASDGRVGVQVVRATHPTAHATVQHAHTHLFWCVLQGAATIDFAGRTHAMTAGGACVLPPHSAALLRAGTGDLQLLEVRLGHRRAGESVA